MSTKLLIDLPTKLSKKYSYTHYRWVDNQCVEFFNKRKTLPEGKSLDQVVQSWQKLPDNELTKCLGKTRQEAVQSPKLNLHINQPKGLATVKIFNCAIALVEINPR